MTARMAPAEFHHRPRACIDFISDLHLGAAPPNLEPGKLHAAPRRCVFILSDLSRCVSVTIRVLRLRTRGPCAHDPHTAAPRGLHAHRDSCGRRPAARAAWPHLPALCCWPPPASVSAHARMRCCRTTPTTSLRAMGAVPVMHPISGAPREPRRYARDVATRASCASKACPPQRVCRLAPPLNSTARDAPSTRDSGPTDRPHNRWNGCTRTAVYWIGPHAQPLRRAGLSAAGSCASPRIQRP